MELYIAFAQSLEDSFKISIERIKTTSMAKGITWMLGKISNYVKCEIKANKR